MNFEDVVLLATIRVCAKEYPQVTLGRIMALAEKYGGLVEYRGGDFHLKNGVGSVLANPKKNEAGAAPAGFQHEYDISGRCPHPAEHRRVSGAYPEPDGERQQCDDHHDRGRVQDPAISGFQYSSDRGDNGQGTESGSGDLNEVEIMLLDRLAALGDRASVSSKDFISERCGARKDALALMGSVSAGKILGALEKRGYVTKVQEKPFALWRALEDSRGAPPPSIPFEKGGQS